FQAEDGIRGFHVTGVQTCALPILFFSSKRVNQNSGTGLGLAIVHGVVKEHAGFVDVTSTPGVGTTFTLYFPIGPALPRSEAPGQDRKSVVEGQRRGAGGGGLSEGR